MLALNGSSDYLSDKWITFCGYHIFHFVKSKKLFNAESCSSVHVSMRARASGYNIRTVYSRARYAHAVFIRKRLITNTVGERNVIFFLYLLYKKRRMKKKNDANPIYRIRDTNGLDGRASICFHIFFFSNIIARRSNAIFILSRSAHQPKYNPKITRFNFDHCCKTWQMKINGKTRHGLIKRPGR